MVFSGIESKNKGAKQGDRRGLNFTTRWIAVGIAILGLLVLLILITSDEAEGQINLQASYVGNKEIHLQWSLGGGGPGCDEFRYYELYEDGGKIATLYDEESREYKRDFLSKDRQYKYRVMSYYWNGSATNKCDNSTEVSVITGQVGGNMLFGTEWTNAKGPYRLVDDVNGDGNSFTIAKGTEIHSNGTTISGAGSQFEDVEFYGGGLVFENHPALLIKDCHFDINSTNPGNQYIIEIYNCSNTTILGNTIVNLIPDPPAFPIYYGIRFHDWDIYACDNAYIVDNDFSDTYSPLNGGLTESCLIQNNTFSDNIHSALLEVGGTDLTHIRENKVIRIDMPLSSEPRGFLMRGSSIHIYENTFEDMFLCGSIHGNSSEISENMVINCTYGFEVDGSDIIIEENLMDGNGYQGSGISISGTGITVYDNEITRFGNFGQGGIFTTGVTNSTIEKNKIWLGGTGIRMLGGTDRIIVKNNNINNNSDYGIYMEGVTNCTIENNTIEEITQAVTPYGIRLIQKNNHNTIRNNTIRNVGKAGIYFGGITSYHIVGNNWHTIEKNTISGAEFGIAMDGYWNDFSNSYWSADNNTILWNTITDIDTGIYLKSSSNNVISDNSILNSESRGVEITYYYWSAQEIAYRSSNNMVQRNRITTLNGLEIHEYAFDVMSTNQYLENTIGINFPTKVSVTGFNSEISIDGLESLPVRPKPPAHQTIGLNISNFVKIHYWGDPFQLIFHYEDLQLRGLNEDMLRVWKFDTMWSDDRDMNLWNIGWNLDYLENTITLGIANLTYGRYQVFAPLIEILVYNIDTDEHFTTIQAAIDDFDTKDGHTIYVGPPYNDTLTFENLFIYKRITLVSTSGIPEENHIKALDPDTDVVEISVNEVTITGFTIRGSTIARGINAGIDTHDILIKNCILKKNFNGLLFKQTPARGGILMEHSESVPTGETVGTRAGFNPIIIENCAFDANSNAGILVDGTLNVLVRDSQFSGGQFGIAIQNSHNARIDNCSLSKHTESGIYILTSTKTTVFESRAEKCSNGIHISDSENSEISWSGTIDCETGIRLVNAHDSMIHNTTTEKLGMFGIHLQGSNGNHLRDIIITESAGTVIIGIELRNSDENIIDMVKVRDITTVGYSATGIRILSGSTRNMVIYTLVSNITSSNSTGIVVGSTDNEFVPVTISDISSFGQDRCAGIHVLPNANANFFSFIDILDITANRSSYGVYLESNGHNNFSDCSVGPVGSQFEKGMGFGYHGCPSGKVISSEIFDTDIAFLCEAGSTPEFHWNTIEGNADFGVRNIDPSVFVDAENNYWGHNSGPGGAGPGSGDAVSDYVDFDPWTGGQPIDKHEETVQPGIGTMDSKATSDTEVDYDTSSAVTITTQKYVSNPGSTFTGDFGKYIDVHLTSDTGVNSLEIRLYYTSAELGNKDESKLRMYWWNGQNWLLCSDSGVETADTGEYAGYIWAKVSTDTSPAISDMSGTPFGATLESDGEDDDDDNGVGAALIIILVVVIIVVLLVVLMKMGYISLDGTEKTGETGTGDQVEPGKEPAPPPIEKEPEAVKDPMKSDESKGTGKGTDNETDMDGNKGTGTNDGTVKNADNSSSENEGTDEETDKGTGTNNVTDKSEDKETTKTGGGGKENGTMGDEDP